MRPAVQRATCSGRSVANTIPVGDPTCPSGGNPCSYCYLSDGAGSVAALTDSTGSVQDSYSYDPMGNATSTGNVPNAFTFSG